MNAHGHFRTVCTCGQVISQCRCPAKDKFETVILNGCPLCRNKPPIFARPKPKPSEETPGIYAVQAGQAGPCEYALPRD